MSPDTSTAPSRRSLRLFMIIALIVAAVVIVFGLVSRAASHSKMKDWTDEQAVPTVAVIAPGSSGESTSLELPGRIEAYSTAPLYARINGYLKSWSADIGAPVKAGQVLAEIETPDLDQQLLAAKADLASARANASLAGTTAKRWKSMLGTDAVSKQEVDEKSGDYTTKQAMVNAAKANLDRIEATKNFTRIVAPFDGIVTARNTDVGNLINIGGAPGQELFVVSDVRKLRIYVNVPQNYVPTVPPGTKATIHVPDRPGKTYTATVESSAQSVNVASGTTLMQLVMDNPNGELLPGGFANVALDLPRDAAALTIPASALIFDKQGLRVAVVGDGNKIALKKVTVARDLGKVIQIGSGLDAKDRVVESPPDGVADGDVVRIAERAKKEASDGKGAAKPDAADAQKGDHGKG